jgi:hypothetical protein
VVDGITDGTLGKHGAVVSEIKARDLEFIGCCKILFEGRSSNFEAHELARHGLSLEGGRHLGLGIPYDVDIPVNILINQ